MEFIIAGEAKSAGTLLALSADELSMTDTGSLGPIDAQIQIGRMRVSAYDYVEWVKEKREEAIKNNALNTFDAIMVAQISPGELKGVQHSLEFATTLVEEWLFKYKFRDWKVTRSRKIVVTDEMKRARAKEVAEKLANHAHWKSHGRSLKMEDLNDLLIIRRIDEDSKLSDIIYRINTIIRLLFSSSPYYKIYFLEDIDLEKTIAIVSDKPVALPDVKGKNVKFDIGVECPRCKTENIVFGYLNATPDSLQKAGLPRDKRIKNNGIVCKTCKFPIDLSPIKANLETKLNKPLIL